VTTAQSPAEKVRAQAMHIAALLLAIERGDLPKGMSADKLAKARSRDTFKAGIIMDDKTVIVEIAWDAVRDTNQEALTDFIISLMRGTPQ